MGCAALIAATYGAHGLSGVDPAAVKIYATASLQHGMHAIVLALTAVLLVVTEGRRGIFGSLLMNSAAFAFLAGMILFSGSLYYQVVRGVQDMPPIAPIGGTLLMLGWLALALSAFGIRRAG
jgi:uncharacterized membrane protein YgdD (TMEM256/DUF423 family)